MLGRAISTARLPTLTPSALARCSSITPHCLPIVSCTTATSLSSSSSSSSTLCDATLASNGVRGYKVRIIAPRQTPKRNRLPTPRQIRAASVRMEGVPAVPIDTKVVADPALTPTITHPVVDLAQNEIGRVTLNSSIWNAVLRRDIVHRVVKWHRDNRRQGTHSSKTRAEVSGTGRKPYRQKGTGRARQGTLRAPHMRGGGRVFGPKYRSHAWRLPRKIRQMGLKIALTSKLRDGHLVILDQVRELPSHKTRPLAKLLAKFDSHASLLVHGADELDDNWKLAARNIDEIDLISDKGANTYDILRRKKLFITREGLAALEARLLYKPRPIRFAVEERLARSAAASSTA